MEIRKGLPREPGELTKAIVTEDGFTHALGGAWWALCTCPSFLSSLIVSKPFFCRKSEPGKEVTGSGKSHE